MSSLAAQLAEQFSNSAPVFSDPEDDIRNGILLTIFTKSILVYIHKLYFFVGSNNHLHSMFYML